MSSVTDEQQINTPRKLHLSGIGRVIDVACGGTVCMILNGGSEVRTDHPSTLQVLQQCNLHFQRNATCSCGDSVSSERGRPSSLVELQFKSPTPSSGETSSAPTSG